MIGGYEEGGADGAARPRWRSVSLQGCPREVRLLLAGRGGLDRAETGRDRYGEPLALLGLQEARAAGPVLVKGVG